MAYNFGSVLPSPVSRETMRLRFRRITVGRFTERTNFTALLPPSLLAAGTLTQYRHPLAPADPATICRTTRCPVLCNRRYRLQKATRTSATVPTARKANKAQPCRSAEGADCAQSRRLSFRRAAGTKPLASGGPSEDSGLRNDPGFVSRGIPQTWATSVGCFT